MIIRSHSAIGILAASILATSAALTAQTPKPATPATPAPAAAQTRPPAPEEYNGTTVNMTPGAGVAVSIQVLRWSADADRDKVVAAVTGKTDKDADLAKTLQDTPTVGYIWTGGSLGYTLKYAHRQTLPDGSEQIVVMSDRPLGSWERTGPWKAATGATESDKPVTVIELHLNKAGVGQGKMSLSSAFAVDDKTKTLGLVNYGSAAILLKDVKHKPASRES
jgi:hypothetical protein